MKVPSFVTEHERLWLLTQDEYIRKDVQKCGCLNWDGMFEKVLAKVKEFRPDGTVIDVGAFVGDTTAWFVMDYPDYITFEPQRDAFTCLIHNLYGGTHFPFPAGNGESVVLDTIGEPENNPGGRGVKLGGPVPTMRIDDLALDNVAFIKIDAEGWEPNVLAGAVETIQRCRPLVVCEVNLPKLKDRGFTADDIEKHFPGWTREVIYRYEDVMWDTLFIPPSTLTK